MALSEEDKALNRYTQAHLELRMKLTSAQVAPLPQNIDDADVMATLISYGQVPTHREGELIRASETGNSKTPNAHGGALLTALAARLAGDTHHSRP